MANESLITAALEVDPALVQSAGYRMDSNDRAYLDAQNRGVQQHLVDSLIRGVVASWFQVHGSSAELAPGDVFCLAGSSSAGVPLVTLATSGALATSFAPMGVALMAAAPGAKVRGAVAGVVPAAITGITSGGRVRVGADGAAELIGGVGYESADYPLGFADASGNLTLHARGVNDDALLIAPPGDFVGDATILVVARSHVRYNLTAGPGVVELPDVITSKGLGIVFSERGGLAVTLTLDGVDGPILAQDGVTDLTFDFETANARWMVLSDGDVWEIRGIDYV